MLDRQTDRQFKVECNDGDSVSNLRSLNRASRMMKRESMEQLATKIRMVSTTTIWMVAAKR